MNISKENIDRLINEAIANLGAEAIYNAALRYVDFEALQQAQPISNEDLCATFAAAGFAAGIKYTLENLEEKEKDDGKESEA